MIVFHAGLPRSGTVLVGAIVRHLCAAKSIGTVQHNPHGPELPSVVAGLLERHPEPDCAHLIHAHSWDDGMRSILGSDLGGEIMGLLCLRDPRDVCVSLMKLHDFPFPKAAQFTLANLFHFDWMRRETNWPVLPYAELKNDKRSQIRFIAAHLGMTPDGALVEQIDEATSVAVHRAVMVQVRSGQVAQLRQRKNQYRTLREDAETLINDRHIQSGKIGRWKDELSLEQAAELQELCSAYAYSFDP